MFLQNVGPNRTASHVSFRNPCMNLPSRDHNTSILHSPMKKIHTADEALQVSKNSIAKFEAFVGPLEVWAELRWGAAPHSNAPLRVCGPPRVDGRRCLGSLAPSSRIETLITRHTERRAGFTSGLDTPKQTKGMYHVVRDKKKKLDMFFSEKYLGPLCVLCSKVAGEIEPH